MLHLSKVQIYYKLENASVVVYRPSPCGKEITQNRHRLVQVIIQTNLVIFDKRVKYEDQGCSVLIQNES